MELCVFLCVCAREFKCMCVPSNSCVQIMNHLGARRRRKTKRKLSDREKSPPKTKKRHNELSGDLCLVPSVYKIPSAIQIISTVWKEKKNNTICSVIIFCSYPAVYMYIHMSFHSVAIALSKIDYKICNLCLLHPGRVANASWLPLSVDTLWPRMTLQYGTNLGLFFFLNPRDHLWYPLSLSIY